MLARLEAHVAEQQRFAANASHELRTPLAITQTLLDVARNDPNRDTGELVDRLHAVNTRAIDLTEALLLLSRADQRSFTREHVDLSLIAEEATETLLPLAEKRGLTIETSGDLTPTIGSHALLLQLTTNLVHNAIVHNLPEQGTVWVTTSVHPESVVLTVENTGEKLTPQLVATLVEPFLRGTERIRTDHAGVGLGLAIVKSITQAHDGTLTLTPRAAGGLRVTVQLPLPHRTPADDEQDLRPATPAAASRRRSAPGFRRSVPFGHQRQSVWRQPVSLGFWCMFQRTRESTRTCHGTVHRPIGTLSPVAARVRPCQSGQVLTIFQALSSAVGADPQGSPPVLPMSRQSSPGGSTNRSG